MQPDDFQPVVANDGAYRFRLGKGQVPWIFLECEGGDFEALVTGIGGAGASVRKAPAFIGLIADGKFHRGNRRGLFARRLRRWTRIPRV